MQRVTGMFRALNVSKLMLRRYASASMAHVNQIAGCFQIQQHFRYRNSLFYKAKLLYTSSNTSYVFTNDERVLLFAINTAQKL